VSDDEIQVIRATYRSGEDPRAFSLTFALHNLPLKSRKVVCDGVQFFLVTRPDGTFQRFRQNPESGEGDPVDSIPCGDPLE
jgi:hypothetical protein